MRGSLIFTLFLGVFVGLLLVVGFTYPVEVRILPLVVGSPTLFLILVLLVGEFHPPVMQWMDSVLEDLWGGTRLEARARTSGEQRLPWTPVLRVVGWSLAFFGMVFFFGLFVVPPIFIALYLLVEAGMGAVKVIGLTLGAGFVLYGGMSLLRIDLWTGAIPEVIPGILGGGIVPPL